MGSGWRAALLGTVAAGALWSLTPKPARAGPDACTTVGATATCTGNQSGGIHSGADFNPATVDTLNVNSLTTNITPPANTSGIYFGRINPGDTITINSDTTPHAISVTGTADGIVAVAPGDVTVNHTGDITSAGDNGITVSSGSGIASVTATGAISAFYDGISAFGNNGVSVSHTGDLTAQNHFGIHAFSAGGPASIVSVGNVTAYNTALYAQGPGDVTVNSTGNLTSHILYGISAASSFGAASVTSNGNINAASGIFATGNTTTTVTSTGNITATTYYGIRASSVAGTAVTSHGNISAYADGIRAIALGPLADVTVNSTGDVTSTHGSGIFAGSTYGKATVISSGTISAFGNGIRANGYGDVSVTHTGDITSQFGRGIRAYSVYGKVSVTSTGTISAASYGISAKGYDDVTVTHTGDITSQVDSGIYAFSQYGKATVTHTGTISAFGDGISAIAYGDVSVTHTGNITARNGDGIYAYSHNGTATVVSSGNIKVYGTCGCSANGIFAYGYNGVGITHTGDISSATGIGIVAFSLNGPVSITSVGKITAYYYGINAQAANGDVTINHTGDITATGVLGIGINAAAGGNINVTVNGGKISGSYAGIFLLGGYTNTVSVGSTATVTGGTYAIAGTIGDDTVNNFGTVTGNVRLGLGSNAFNNMPGGLFNSGAIVDLGIGGALTNDGTLSPGGAGTVQSTFLVGNFVQNSGGRFAVDVDMTGGTADFLGVIGTASLAGKVVPHVINLAAPPQSFTILSSGGTTDNGLTVQNSAAVKYQLAFDTPTPNDVQLTVAGINFAPSGLTPNETAIGQHLQGAFGAGGGDLNTLLLYLANLDLADFANALDHLSPESYLAQTQAQLLGSLGFANTLFSCPLPASGPSLMGEGRCYWLQPSGHVGDHSAQTGFIGYDEKAAGITGGAQNELAPNWYLDVGFGYERSHIDVDNNLASARGDVFHGGAALKYINGNWLVAGSVSGGIARYDTNRYGIPTAGTTSANADTDTLDLRLRFAYAFGTEAFYVKPLVDFDGIGLWRGAINETGAGPLDLRVQSQNDWVASAAPAVEFGTQWQHDTTIWRPYVRAGVRFLSKDSFSATASFEGSPAGVAPFTVTTPIDQTLAEVSAGVDVWQGTRFSLRVAYEGRFGSHTSENGGELKLRAAF